MADNFRNKQWFKNLSQERKDEICKKFDIDEKTLKKAGRQTEDGRIVVDVLRIDHLLHTPESWDEYYDNISILDLSEGVLDLCLNKNDLNEQLSVLKFTYDLLHTNNDWKKYKPSVHNDLLVRQAFKNFMHWFNERNATDPSDKEHIKFCCYQIYTHCKCLLESDLDLVK